LTPEAKERYPIGLYNRSEENAGFDLYTSTDVHVTQQVEFVPFGVVARLIRVEPLPQSHAHHRSDSHFFLMPRSSIYKSGLIMANSVGVIDKSYRGELKAPVWSMTGSSTVRAGERWFQIVAPDMGWIRNIRLVDELPETDRGAGGFGSSGS
jgi:dUTP pyrophosphatase